VPDNFGGQLEADPNLAQMTTPPPSVAQHSAYLQCLPDPPDPTPFQQSPYKDTDIFNQAQDFTVTGTFVDSNGEIPLHKITLSIPTWIIFSYL
jgi:hypothetical protein